MPFPPQGGGGGGTGGGQEFDIFTGRNDGLVGTEQGTTDYFFPAGFSPPSTTITERIALWNTARVLQELKVWVTQNSLAAGAGNVEIGVGLYDLGSGIDIGTQGAGFSMNYSPGETGVKSKQGGQRPADSDRHPYIFITVPASNAGETVTLEAWGLTLAV